MMNESMSMDEMKSMMMEKMNEMEKNDLTMCKDMMMKFVEKGEMSKEGMMKMVAEMPECPNKMELNKMMSGDETNKTAE